MLTFLKIVAGFFLALILVVVFVVGLGYLWLRSKLRKFAGNMADALASFGRLGRFLPPMRLKLEPTDDLEWEAPEAVKAFAEPLAEAGFVPAGRYTAMGNMPVKLQGLAHPGLEIYAAIYEIAPAGVWMDLVSQYTDGTGLTYTTARPTGMKRPPGKPSEHLPGLGAKDLLDRFLSARPQSQRRPTPPDQFAARLETAYAEEMDWMIERGGPTEEEIRAVASADGSEVEPDTIRLIQQGWLRHFNEFRAEQLRERFVATSGVSAAEWEGIRDRLVFIHDQLGPEELLTHFGVGAAEEEEPDEDAIENEAERDAEEEAERRRAQELREIAANAHSPRAAFSRMNERWPQASQYTKHSQVREPLEADVWLRPEE